MTGYPKRLIEVDLPIKHISAHARREKSIRHGHMSTLHIWWARRPLAACRAVLCASLWPDPADDLCPQAFRDAAALALANFADQVRTDEKLAGLCAQHWMRWKRTNAASLRPDNPACWLDMRYALLDFIADFANWDATTVPAFVETARILTRVAHLSLTDPNFRLPTSDVRLADDDLESKIQKLKSKIEALPRPLVVDPFAGGGSIPLEALRVGADAFASDLNPVAVLLNKVVLEYIPKYGQRLTDEVRKWGQWIQERAEKDLDQYYPEDSEGGTPLAYLWARTIACEGPGCGASVPLMRSLWLGKKPGNSWALRIVTDHKLKRVDFEVVRGMKPLEVQSGTVHHGSVVCPVCGYTTPVDSVRRQLRTHRGGTSHAQLVCVVTTRSGAQGRFYRVPNRNDMDALRKASTDLGERIRSHCGPLELIPAEPLPPQGTLGFRLQQYGMDRWGDLFSDRQALVLTTLSELTTQVGRMVVVDAEYAEGLGEAVHVALALNVDKMADYGSALARWLPQASQETVAHTFARPALAMVWDFAEAYPFAASSGGWHHGLGFLASPLEAESTSFDYPGTATCADAADHPLPNDVASAFISDPPYYDAIPYGDLSDFFVVWLKRSLVGTASGASFLKLAPKDRECVVDEIKGHDGAYFEQTMSQAMLEGRRLLRPDGIGVIVFANKSTSGWEAQLQALVDSGWTVSGSWPIDTERGSRLRAMNSAALASSIHLVCRPREVADGSAEAGSVGDWRDVLAELPGRIHEWMPRLASEGVVGADAIFACLGPALEIFSRYERVEKASGDQVTLKEYLEYVWAAVAKEALTMILEGADASGLEEDARLTAMWLWTLSTADSGGAANQSTENDVEDDEEGASSGGKLATGYFLEFDAARKIAQGLGAHLERLTSLIEVKGDKARLLPVAERARHLFGKDEGQAPARRQPKPAQLGLLATLDEADQEAGGWGEKSVPEQGNTVLDRVHQSMILFAAGRSEALKRFLVEEKAGTDQRFWHLAQALSALYPAGSDEKRWVDGVLARKKGLGF